MTEDIKSLSVMRTQNLKNTRTPSQYGKPPRRRLKIADEIVESMRQDIVARRLQHGERLPSENELSERYGVSQPTIREATRALETLGLIVVVHGSGTFVRSEGEYGLASALQTLLQLESVSIMEVISVRQVLGRHSVELAASNATDEDLESIAQACDQLKRIEDTKDLEQVFSHIIGFQRALSVASHSPLLQSLELFLLALLHEVQVTSLAGRGLKFWRSRALEFQVYRVAILEGVRSGDPVKAGRAMDRYFKAQRERFEKDKKLRTIDLTSPGLINIVSDMVRQFRK
jgi:GntR family transcriptional repressor for pyruvate dehydrogenase complex